MRFLLFAGVASAFKQSYSGYTVYRADFDSVENLRTAVANCELNDSCDVWGYSGLHADMCVNSSRALPANLNMSVLIKDVQDMMDQAMKQTVLTADPFFSKYQRYDDIKTKVQQIASSYPGAVFIPSIGQTAGKRDIFGISLGGGSKPVATIYIQGGIHAREWISPATVMFILNSLTSSEDAKHILDKLQIVAVPLLNADGYEYTHTNDRMWRKNRVVNSGSSCIGVDLNRNWGDHWGGPGSSGSPCSDTYRGTKAFSELESAAVKDFWAGKTPPAAFIDFHSYGQLMLRPYGWQLPGQGVPPNEAEVKAVTAKMVAAIKATHGMSYTNEHAAELYVACGGADDWFYSEGTKGGISLTIELRDTGSYGFALPPAQIVPTGEEALQAFLVLANHVLSQHA